MIHTSLSSPLFCSPLLFLLFFFLLEEQRHGRHELAPFDLIALAVFF
jgi:hypothetical protein